MIFPFMVEQGHMVPTGVVTVLATERLLPSMDAQMSLEVVALVGLVETDRAAVLLLPHTRVRLADITEDLPTAAALYFTDFKLNLTDNFYVE